MVDKFKILLVHRDPGSLSYLEPSLKKFGVSFFSSKNGGAAVDLIANMRPDILVTDLRASEKNGLTVLREIQKFDPNIFIIIMAALASMNKTMAAMGSGVFDYIPKSFTPEQFEFSIQKAITQKELNDKKYSEPTKAADSCQFAGILGKSPVMQKLFEKVAKVCQSDANVIIYGESGTGKELFARAVHANSKRAAQAFIPVDCVALPETLLESELFGYEKGAFTGAVSMSRGLLEYADRGTLFLDEITELAPNLQAKLLRVLQEQEFRRVGGKKLQRVDMRVVSATNRNPLEAVQANALREDLYYRLNVIPLEIPPLRQRKEDIPLFIELYLEHFGNSYKYNKLTIEDAAMRALIDYRWPGNVRELRNLIECLVSLSEGPIIGFSDLPENITCRGSSASNGQQRFSQLTQLPFLKAKSKVLLDFEEEYFARILKSCEGNISKAARKAEISRRTFYRMINTHKLQKLI